MSGYESLFNYYKECFSMIDCFHFNSEVSKSVYTSHLSKVNGIVVPITHSGIKDNRRVKSFDNDVLRIGFIGSEEPFKGLPLLINVLNGIGVEEKWELSVWGGRIAKDPSLPIYYRGKFSSESIEKVYDNMDVLIVPSVWKETFSLVTLEAMSYGVPVIVSDNVGAQDIVKEYDPKFVFHGEEELKNLLMEMLSDRSVLRAFNDRLLNMEWKYSMQDHAEEVVKEIYGGGVAQ